MGANFYATYVWETASGREVSRMRGASRVALSPDGQMLAFVYNGVHLFDPRSGLEIRELEEGDKYHARVAFSPDGRLLAASACEDGKIRVWDVATGTLVATRGKRRPMATDIGFLPTGRRLLIARNTTRLELWDLAEDDARSVIPHSDHEGDYELLSIARTAGVAAAASDSFVEVFDPCEGRHVLTIEGGARALALSPDGSRLAVMSYGDLRCYEVPSGRLLCASEEARAAPFCTPVFLPNNETILVADETRYCFVDSSRGALYPARDNPSGSVHRLAFSNDSTALSSASTDRRVQLWSVNAAKSLGALDGSHSSGGSVVGMCFSHRGQRLHVLRLDGQLTTHAVPREGGELTLLRQIEATDMGRALTICPEGELLAIADDAGHVVLLQEASGGEIARLESEGQHPQALFFGNGRALWSCDKKRWRVWRRNLLGNWSADQPTELDHAAFAWAFSPGAEVGFMAAGKQVLAIDLATSTPREHYSLPFLACALASSADGSLVAIGCTLNNLVLWDLEAKRSASVRQRLPWAAALAFSPDGTRLAAGMCNGTIELIDPAQLEWDATPPPLFAEEHADDPPPPATVGDLELSKRLLERVAVVIGRGGYRGSAASIEDDGDAAHLDLVVDRVSMRLRAQPQPPGLKLQLLAGQRALLEQWQEPSVLSEIGEWIQERVSPKARRRARADRMWLLERLQGFGRAADLDRDDGLLRLELELEQIPEADEVARWMDALASLHEASS